MSGGIAPIPIPSGTFTASEAESGVFLNVSATSDPGDTLHTLERADLISLDGWTDTGLDIISISACNTDTVSRDLNVQWGVSGVTGRIVVTLPAKTGLVDVVVSKRILRGSTITVWASVTAVVNVHFQREPYLIRR